MEIKSQGKIFFLLFLIFPISIVVGPTISLINLILLELSFLFFFIFAKDFSVLKTNTIKLLLVLYLYLFFNSLISLDYQAGLARNIGFIRVIVLFLFINYFFFYFNKSQRKIFDIWLIFFIIFMSDIYFEFIFGANIFGWGEINKTYSIMDTKYVKFLSNEYHKKIDKKKFATEVNNEI